MNTLEKNEAFQLAVERYADMVYRVAVHAAPRREDAEDVVQDTYEKLLRTDKRFESEAHLKAWLIRVAINRCHDLCRAACTKDLELDEGTPAAPSGEDGHVLAAVRALPERYRSAIYLHYYEGYTAAEIGGMLGVPGSTVLTWLARGRGRLHELLKEEIEDEVV
jgi:RNA polymerase sigma factor (sigma-70 family)